MNQQKILMIGPDINSQGGISSVIKLYYDSCLLDDTVIFLPSYQDGSTSYKIIFFVKFLIKYIYILISNKNIRLIHIHMATKGSFFRKAIAVGIAKFFRKKVILNIHPIGFSAFYDRCNAFIKKMITNTLNKSDLILLLSEKIKVKIADICSNTSIRILYNPVIIKEPVCRVSEPINILFLGKLCKEKGVYDIIEAAKLIKNPNAKINLYGDGNLDKFVRLIADNNLHEKVKLNNWISGIEKDEALQNSDIYILPSYSEGLPMSILETMSVGLPIISTPVGGTPEAVEEGVNGFLIQPGDYVGLAEKIDLLANNRLLREQMGHESYKIAKERFDIKIIIKQLQDIYSEMLK